MTSPTWYDLLDVDRDAPTEEIRAAWKAAVADLDPTDRRFRALSEAASVLLDADKRAAYDADLAAQEAKAAEAAEGAEAGSEVEARTEVGDDAAVAAGGSAPRTRTEQGAEKASETTRRGLLASLPVLPLWLLGAVGVLAVAAVVAAVLVLVHGSSGSPVITAENKNSTTSTVQGSSGQRINNDHVTLIEEHAVGALQAAKAAVVPILSYDYRHLSQDQQRAHAYMTAAYRKKYDPLFATIKANAPHLKAVVTTNPPVDAGIVRVSGDRVQVLVFVDRPTTNAKSSKPIPYQDYVTLTMVDQGGHWLVDNLETTPAGS